MEQSGTLSVYDHRSGKEQNEDTGILEEARCGSGRGGSRKETGSWRLSIRGAVHRKQNANVCGTTGYWKSSGVCATNIQTLVKTKRIRSSWSSAKQTNCVVPNPKPSDD